MESTQGNRFRKWLFGCLIGCGGIVVLATATCVGFSVWLTRPGELLDAERLLGNDTTAYVQWTLRLEDPGTADTVEALLDRMTEARGQVSILPPALQGWVDRRDEARFRNLFPMLAAWSLRHDPGSSEPDQLFSVSLKQMGNRMVLADWIIGWAFGRSAKTDLVRYGGEKIYPLEDDRGAFFLRRSDVFFTSDVATAKRAVDALSASAERAGPAELIALLAGVPADRPLRGAALNSRGDVGRIVEWIGGKVGVDALADLDWSGASALVLDGGFDDRAFVGELTLIGDPAWLTEYTPRLEQGLRARLEEFGLDSPLEARLAGDRAVYVVRVEDLPGFLDRFPIRVR